MDNPLQVSSNIPWFENTLGLQEHIAIYCILEHSKGGRGARGRYYENDNLYASLAILASNLLFTLCLHFVMAVFVPCHLLKCLRFVLCFFLPLVSFCFSIVFFGTFWCVASVGFLGSSWCWTWECHVHFHFSCIDFSSVYFLVYFGTFWYELVYCGTFLRMSCWLSLFLNWFFFK